MAPPQGTPLISSFFKKAAPANGAPAASKKRHVVELSSDEEEHIAAVAESAPAAAVAGPSRSGESQPPAKVARTGTDTTPRSKAQERQELAERKAAAKAAQREEWSFKPSQTAPRASGTNAVEMARGALLPSPTQASQPSSSSQRAEEPARRRELRKRLLGPDDPLARLTSQGREDASEEDEEVRGAADTEETAAPGPSNRFGKYAAPSAASKTPAASAAKGRSGSTSKKKGDEYTPLEKQILALKEENPGVLLAVEVGYKVKFYNEDARIAARELSIMCYPDNHLLAAMVPVHRLHIHVRRLVAAGHKVGVVRQIETRALKAMGSNKSAPFDRKVTALYTAATWVDDLASDVAGMGEEAGFANPAATRSLLAIVEQREGGNGPDDRVCIGLVAIQANVGSITFDQFSDTHVRSELETRLAHLQPAEVLIPEVLSKQTEKMIKHVAGASSASAGSGRIRVERRPFPKGYDEAWRGVSRFYEEGMLQLSNATDAGKILAVAGKLPHLSLIAMAAAIQHLEGFGLENLFRMPNFASFADRNVMLLTSTTLDNLEIYRNSDGYREKGSLIWLLDRCKTAFGRRMLRRWVGRPLTDVDMLRARGDAVQALVNGGAHPITLKIPSLLQGLPDLEKGLARMSYGRDEPTELATVLLSLNRIAFDIEPVAEPEDLGMPSSVLNDAVAALPRVRSCVKTALDAISLKHARANEKTELFVDPDLYPELQELKSQIAIYDNDLAEHLVELRKQLRMPKLSYATVSNETHLIEIRAGADAKKMPADWTRVSATQKYVRFHTPTVLKIHRLRDAAVETLASEANRCYRSFVQALCDDHYTILRDAIMGLATLDALVSLANVALLPGWVRPTFDTTGRDVLQLKGFRHPVSEALVDDYVPNDICLGGDEARGVLLTGSNMGGKSSTVRAIALLVVLAQIGSYVPAESAHLSMHDAVLTRMGASDELAKGRSTFMVEMSETAEILRTATERSLVILDELGRGTSTFDGQAVAHAVLVHLLTRATGRPKLLFVTHFLALGALAQKEAGLSLEAKHMAVYERAHERDEFDDNIDEAARPGAATSDITFLYKLRPGLASKSFGIHCAALAGLPAELLESARIKAAELESWSEARAQRALEMRARRAVALFAPGGQMDGPAVEDAKKAARALGLFEGELADETQV